MKLAAVLLVCAAFAGCSTIQSRIEKNRAAFQHLSSAERSLVARGEVREGMNPDAVYIAWGRPDEVTHGTERGRALETWTYFRYSQQSIPDYEYIPRRAGRSFTWEPSYRPQYITQTGFDRRAVFSGGKVVSWEMAAW